MSPIPGWLAGAQGVALNTSNVDTGLMLHYALFKGSGGYVLKPVEMQVPPSPVASSPGGNSRSTAEEEDADDNEDYWPPPRKRLHRTTLEIISLHQLPKVSSCFR
jgi:hypothetical protein